MMLSQTRAQAIDLDIYDVLHLLTTDRMEDDDFINTVDKFWPETFFTQPLPDVTLDIVFIHAVIFVQPAIPDVTRHDDDGIFEVYCPPLPIGEASVIEQLQ